MRSRMLAQRVAVTVVALASGLALAAPAGAATKHHRHARARAAARLVPFDDCSALIRYAKARAAAGEGTVGAGFPGRPVGLASSNTAEGAPTPTTAPTPATAQAPSSDTSTTASPDTSTTNVQEAGVDEPDIVKSDGHVVYAVENGTLFAVDGRSGPPKVLGSLAVPQGYGAQLLLDGDHLFVLGSEGFAYPVSGPPQPVAERAAAIAPVPPGGPDYYYSPRTTLTEVDVHDPAAMAVTNTESIDGSFVDARAVGDSARVIVASAPRAIYQPEQAPNPAGWVPQATVTRSGAASTTHSAVPCRSVRRPRVFGGLGMVTVLTVDMKQGLPAVDADAVMTDAQTVYASPRRLYLATQRWEDPQTPATDLPSTTNTTINAFDITDPHKTTYLGSGSLAGTLLNQFALSEYNGVLRAATTTTPPWEPQQGETLPSGEQSMVTTFAEGDGGLVPIGRVSGLGQGEGIYAVRFVGNAGYVVTFRQIDPLFVLDLSDPTAPRVTGQLDLEGYSSYLHPLDDGLLLGVGEDVDAQNRRAGVELSLFDVSDPAHPRRLAHQSAGLSSYSSAEYDHHAFLYWAPRNLAVLPLQAYDANGQGFSGAVAYKVTRSGISEAGRVSAPSSGAQGDYAPPIDRALVMGSRLLTLSAFGLEASALDTFAGAGIAPFPQPQSTAQPDQTASPPPSGPAQSEPAQPPPASPAQPAKPTG